MEKRTATCSCGHVISFANPVWCRTEVICPECGQIVVVDPEVVKSEEDAVVPDGDDQAKRKVNK